MRNQINIQKMAESFGFTICYQAFQRRDILGYIHRGEVNLIVISKQDQNVQRFVIADCLVHYLESNNQDDFYYVSKTELDYTFLKLTADLLIPTKTIKRLAKRKTNLELSKYFEVPLFLIEYKLEEPQKVKKYQK